MVDSNKEAQKRTIKSLLTGKPVGSIDGDFACDLCNRDLSKSEQLPNLVDADTHTVYVSVVQPMAQLRWQLKWISCEECGPTRDWIGVDGEPIEPPEVPGTAKATATLAYKEQIDGVALTNIRDITVIPKEAV